LIRFKLQQNVKQDYIQLNTGEKMPLLGLGVYNMHGVEAENAVAGAIQMGYRLIDTATSYNNEQEVGLAIRNSGISRNELFITTKVPNTSQGYDSTFRAFENSMKALNIDYIDLYLVHWPIKATRKETWKALEQLYNDKRVRSVGVANYLEPFLDELATYSDLVPAVNQVEFSPFLYLSGLLEKCNQMGIRLQAYTPISRGKKFENALLKELSEKYQKTVAQIILRWDIQHQVSAIPKSANPVRQKENLSIFDFNIEEADMARLDEMNENYRVVDDPITLL
jgi:diketogulonate reductase-like aldo/keto reductase